MKLPWISRRRFEAELHYLRFERDTARASDEFSRRIYAEMHRRYGDLLEKYHALALQINTPPVVPEARTPDDLPVKRERSVVSQTIKEEANGNPKVAAWLQKRARELRAENKTPDEIATELRRWQSTEDVKE